MSSPRSRLPGSSYRVYFVGDQQVAVTLHEPSPRPTVPEALVHDLWAYQQFDTTSLQTTREQPLRVQDVGTHNTDSGADFTGACLHIGDMEWRGDVEIHCTSSDWFAHKHHVDTRYNSTILHVSLFADAWTGGLLREDGSLLPELVLYPRLTAPLRQLLHRFHTAETDDLPCAPRWQDVPDSVRASWLKTLARKRMETKVEYLATRYQEMPDLNQLLYERLFAGLGYSKNARPMEDLARRVPLSIAHTVDEPRDLEALYFGVAHLIPEPSDLLDTDRATADYATDLRRRFQRLNARFEIPMMSREAWKFFRLRPANFPPLRIAQGAALVQDGLLRTSDPIGTITHALSDPNPLATVRDLLTARPHAFWDRHIRLSKTTKPRNPQLGTARIDTLLINAAAPTIWLYAQQYEEPALPLHVENLLRSLPAERDSVVRRFTELGTRPESAFESQALHHLYRMYCQEARCLTCRIGQTILGTDDRTKRQTDE